MSVLLEVCVDDLAGLDAAIDGGADRIELCSALDLGGVTPSAGLMAEAARRAVPVVALIRPHAGGFVYGAEDERAMLRDIELAAELGLAGVAIGALTHDAALDIALLERLIARAAGLQLTLHRAFDLVRDQSAALEAAIAFGFDRILTSGGALQAPAGAAQLASLVRQSRSRLRILAGGGISPDNVDALLASTAAHEVHASCRAPGVEPAPELVRFGFAAASSRTTSAAVVRALKARLLSHDPSKPPTP